MEFKKPEMMKEAEKSNKKVSKFGVQILCFIAVFAVINILQFIPSAILMFKDMQIGEELTQENLLNNLSSGSKIVMLFLTVFAIIVPIIYCRFIEKRSLHSMGFVKKHAFQNYLFGLLIGFILFTAVIAFNLFFEAMEFKGINNNLITGSVILYFIGFAIQGMSEEVLCRGYLMNSIGGKHSVGLAIIVSSFVFALLHASNPGLTWLAFINLFLFGLFAAFYMICFDDIWGVSAIHAIWNFAQGIIYGISVSGAYSEENSIMFFKSVDGMNFINGGTFGAEGGIGVTLVLLVGILITFEYMRHSKKIDKRRVANSEN